MNQEVLRTISELTWQDVKANVLALNPVLHDILDTLDPGKQYTVFKAKYLYGDQILQSGKLYIPDNKGNIVSLESSDISTSVQEKLGYNLGQTLSV